MKFRPWIAVIALVLVGCGADPDGVSSSTDAVTDVDGTSQEDSASTDSGEDTSVPEDTLDPPLTVYAAPDLAGDRNDSIISALGPIAVQPAVAVGAGGEPMVVFAGTSAESTDLAIFVASPGRPTALLKDQPGGQRNEPAVCRLADGGFVAVWSYDGQAVGNPLGIEGAVLATDGSVVSSFDVKTEVTGNHWLGHVGCNPDGGFTVVGSRTDTDDTTFGVFAQHYDADGATITEAFSINPSPEGTQVQPVVAVGEGGAGVVLYEDAPTDESYVLTARSFTGNGVESAAFTVLSLGGTDALKPAVSISPGGRVAYAGNLDTQLHLFSGSSLQSPDAFKGWMNPLESRVLPAITFLGDDSHLAMASLLNAIGSGEPSVAVDVYEEGSDTPLTSVLLGNDPKLPPYPPSVAWGDGTLAVAWTQRTDGGFEIHLSTFVGAPIVP